MKYLNFILLSLLAQNLFGQQRNNDWENPTIVDERKEAPRASFMLYANKSQVERDDYAISSYYQPCFQQCKQGIVYLLKCNTNVV